MHPSSNASSKAPRLFLFGGSALSGMEASLSDHLERVRDAAAKHGLEVVMTGILPTLKKADVDLHNMMDRPRYFALNEALRVL